MNLKKYYCYYSKKNFILYDIENIVSKDISGKLIKKDIYLPKGKKPLIISVDDVNYYDYMMNDGFANKLVINEKGDVVTLLRTPNNKLIESYEGDVVPILDEFVKMHPEFSYQGAKGVLALTGFQGVFGYRINTLKGKEQDVAVKQAKAVADKLKKTGWKFANHSYSHKMYFKNGTITLSDLKKELDKWEQFNEPVLGKTSIFISPYGVDYVIKDSRLKYLISRGYYIFCPVYKDMNTVYYSNIVIQTRLNFDGYTMLTKPQRISKYFFKPSDIVDNKRPVIENLIYLCNFVTY